MNHLAIILVRRLFVRLLPSLKQCSLERNTMKSKGKSAWLITWEGPESEQNGRCKVVAVLPAQHGVGTAIFSLRVLFCSECNYTLCEKLYPTCSIRKDPLFKEAYTGETPEYYYGHFPKQYLRARKVKNLRCEESKRDCFEGTLYWTELPKFIPNPNFDPNGPVPDNVADLSKQVMGEKEDHYTYSTR